MYMTYIDESHSPDYAVGSPKLNVTWRTFWLMIVPKSARLRNVNKKTGEVEITFRLRNDNPIGLEIASRFMDRMEW